MAVAPGVEIADSLFGALPVGLLSSRSHLFSVPLILKLENYQNAEGRRTTVLFISSLPIDSAGALA